MGWGEKAIEIRSVETGHLDGVFMHKRAQRLKFLCERNDKVRLTASAATAGVQCPWRSCAVRQVFFASVRSGGSSQVYFMTLNRNCIMNWWRNSLVDGVHTESLNHTQSSEERSLRHLQSHSQPSKMNTHIYSRIPVPTEASRNAVSPITERNPWRASDVSTSYRSVLYIILRLSWFTLFGGPVFCRDDLVPNCEVYYKHSLVVLQEVVKEGLLPI